MDIDAYISSGIIEQYALGTIAQESASILECVMKHNYEVEKAVLQAQETLGDLAMAQSVMPSADLKAKIASKLVFGTVNTSILSEKKVVQLQKSDDEAISLQPRNKNFWAIAASLLLIISLGWNVLNTTSKNTEIEDLANKNNLLKTQVDLVEEQNIVLVNADKIKLLGVETHPQLYATVMYSNSNQVYLQLDNLPNAPAGKEYQLWAIVDGAPVDLGMYDQTNSQKLQPMKAVKNPQAFAITLENQGGSPTPTMEQMYVMGKVG